MLSPVEYKVVTETLLQRHNFLLKTAKENSDPAKQQEAGDLALVLQSAINKLKTRMEAEPKAKSAKATGQNSEEAEPISLEEAKMLVVDDDENVQELVSSALSEMGITDIHVAEDGSSALNQVKTAYPPFHAIICDLKMPKLDGMQVLRALRAERRFDRTYFVMMTATSDNKIIQKAVKHGLNDFMVKPIDLEVLDNKVRKALNLPTP